MRLIHLKLAGFKSFVDATTLHLQGQRIGVVGPNGCGKSNIMEAIRWVLGESSAREMRSDSMHDVIFNGSEQRKAVTRASAELLFDNSLGAAGGSWTQYAEISVKRVIERDKGSSYYINNTLVRRRDVADLFLGTGLGGRAYAIIGQNTVSRIVEAKPEELRVFLEEAAGISKYKERRRETEYRLRDTRENLVRVEDIRQEITKQIARLEAQASVAEQYHQLKTALQLARGRLWLLKKRAAGSAWEKSKHQVARLVNALEAQMATLRSTEALLEKLRQQHFSASAEVQRVQAQYYEINAEVSNLEQQLGHTESARERLRLQLAQINTQLEKFAIQRKEAEQVHADLLLEQQRAETATLEIHARLQLVQTELPQQRARFTQTQDELTAAEKNLADIEITLRLEQSQASYLERNKQELEQRSQDLQQAVDKLQMPDSAVLIAKRSELTDIQTQISRLQQEIDTLQQEARQQAARCQTHRQQQQAAQDELTRLEAQIHSLTKLQQMVRRQDNLDTWLRQQGLQDAQRLWQEMRIDDGWETAVEAALGARINAIIQPQSAAAAKLHERPPASLVLVKPTEEKNPKSNAFSATRTLSSMIECSTASLNAVIEDWLSGVLVLEAGQDSEPLRKQLGVGEMLINRAGDIYTRYSQSWYASHSEWSGVLERQRELDMLNTACSAQEQLLAKARQQRQQAEAAAEQAQQTLQKREQMLQKVKQRLHQQTLEFQRLEQQSQHAQERYDGMVQELEQLAEKCLAVTQQKQIADENIKQYMLRLPELKQACSTAQQQCEQARTTLQQTQTMSQEIDRKLQESTFDVRIINSKIKNIEDNLNKLHEEMSALLNRQQKTQEQLQAAKTDILRARLNASLSSKQQCETALSKARESLAEAETELQHQERLRLQNEQTQHPLRDKLEQSRLAEQEARIGFEQCQAELAACQLDEAVLSAGLTANDKVADIEAQITILDEQIVELGAVNLAAIQELESELERQRYLDSQSQDLHQAIATLEDAIRRIDRETRSRLQRTFEEANHHFAELFKLLFGGGQARLELLGDEILDTGIQVFAQPMGKKNSTIQLLSGGEKALTALALIFALFQLNPAPFCLMDEVDAPLDDSNTERFCNLVKKMSEHTQFLFVSHNKITMEMAQQLVGVTMQESGVSRIVEVDMEAAMRMQDQPHA